VRLELLVVTFLGFTPTAVICDMRGTWFFAINELLLGVEALKTLVDILLLGV
jgi:hypothetical protein